MGDRAVFLAASVAAAAAQQHTHLQEIQGAHIISWKQSMGCLSPKVGTSAWIRYLRQQITGHSVSSARTHEHWTTNGTEWVLPRTPKTFVTAFRQPFRFVVVRHPWDRLVSYYRNVFREEVRVGGGIHAYELGFSSPRLANATFHDVVAAIARRAGPNGTRTPLVNDHYRPQYLLCQLHTQTYHMMLDLDRLHPKQLILLQQRLGFAQRFQPHVSCSVAQNRGEPCSRATVELAKRVYGLDAELIGTDFTAAHKSCSERGNSQPRMHSHAELTAMRVHDEGLDDRFCNDCRSDHCPPQVCPRHCLPPLRSGSAQR